jgi:hypothetical protein
MIKWVFLGELTVESNLVGLVAHYGKLNGALKVFGKRLTISRKSIEIEEKSQETLENSR